MRSMYKIISLSLLFILIFSANNYGIKLKKFLKIGKGINLAKKAATPITETEEYYIGRAVTANILSKYNLLKNAPMTRYINLLGNFLTLRSDRPELYNGYRFAILDTDEINAFAAPGGFILLTRGIIEISANEDQLAAIIAHEISHIVKKHPLKAIKSERIKSLGMFAANETLRGNGSSKVLKVFQNSVLDISGTLLQKGYSRKQEKQADIMAISILKRSGYNPKAILNIMKKLKVVEKKKAKVFSAHPSASKRIKYLKSNLRKINYRGNIKKRSIRFRKFCKG